MTLLTTAGSGSAILTPEQVQSLVIEPLLNQAVATQVSSIVQTASTSTRFPIVKQDPVTTWVAEGAEITPSDQDLDELDCVPKKLGGLSIVSTELVEDSDPSALEVVGSGLVRDLQLRLDSAFFGSTTANGPNGLSSLTGVTHVASGTITDLDAFAEALSEAEQVGAQISAFVTNPDTLLSLSTLKVQTGNNQPLLGTDPASPTRRSVFGVPLYPSPAVSAGVIWGLPMAKSFVVIRRGANVVVDTSAYFSSDRVGIRCTLRVGFAWPHEAAVVNWAVNVLQAGGARVHLAHPLGVKGFRYRRVKNDVRDAGDLADLLRMGRLPEAWIAPPETRQLRELVRYRAKLVAIRSGLKAQIHAVLAKAGVSIAASDLFGVTGRQRLARVPLGSAYAERVRSLLELIDILDGHEARFAAMIAERLETNVAIKRSSTCPASGRCWPAVFVAEIGDVHRFACPAQLCSWAGLTATHRESDTVIRRGHITKQGSQLVRGAAGEAIQRQPDTTKIALDRQRIEARRGRNIAKIAAARKLLTRVYYGLRDGHIRAVAHRQVAA